MRASGYGLWGTKVQTEQHGMEIIFNRNFQKSKFIIKSNLLLNQNLHQNLLENVLVITITDSTPYPGVNILAEQELL